MEEVEVVMGIMEEVVEQEIVLLQQEVAVAAVQVTLLS